MWYEQWSCLQEKAEERSAQLQQQPVWKIAEDAVIKQQLAGLQKIRCESVKVSIAGLLSPQMVVQAHYIWCTLVPGLCHAEDLHAAHMDFTGQSIPGQTILPR